MEMKLIIAGGRDFDDPIMMATRFMEFIGGRGVSLDMMKKRGQIVSGGQRGADAMGENLADTFGIKKKVFMVSRDDWELIGRKAGPIRNAKMAEYADALIAFWDGKSPGTKNMISEAKKRGLKIKIVRYGDN